MAGLYVPAESEFALALREPALLTPGVKPVGPVQLSPMASLAGYTNVWLVGESLRALTQGSALAKASGDYSLDVVGSAPVSVVEAGDTRLFSGSTANRLSYVVPAADYARFSLAIQFIPTAIDNNNVLFAGNTAVPFGDDTNFVIWPDSAFFYEPGGQGISINIRSGNRIETAQNIMTPGQVCTAVFDYDGAAGRFKIFVNGAPVSYVFGIGALPATVPLSAIGFGSSGDLTGFNGHILGIALQAGSCIGDDALCQAISADLYQLVQPVNRTPQLFLVPTASASGLSPTGIVSAESVGMPEIIRGQVNVQPTAIASAEAFGDLQILRGTITLQPSAIASTQIVSSPTVAVGQVVLTPAGIASAQAFGAPLVQSSTITLAPASIASAEQVGNAAVLPGPVSITPGGVPSAEAIGTQVLSQGVITLAPAGITSAEAVGTAALQPGPVTLQPAGAATGEAFGAVTVNHGAVIIMPASVVSAEVFGDQLVIPGVTVLQPAGVSSTESVGTLRIVGGDTDAVGRLVAQIKAVPALAGQPAASGGAA